MLDQIRFDELRARLTADLNEMDTPGRYAADLCRDHKPADIAEVLTWCLNSGNFEYFDRGLSFYSFVVTSQDYIPGNHEEGLNDYLNTEGGLPELVDLLLTGDSYVKAERILLYPELLRSLGLLDRSEEYFGLFLKESPFLLKHLFGYRFVDDGGKFHRDWYDRIIYQNPLVTRFVRLTIMDSQAIDTVTEEEILAGMDPVGHPGLDRAVQKRLDEVRKINKAGETWTDDREESGEVPPVDLVAAVLSDYLCLGIEALESGTALPRPFDYLKTCLEKP